jgi:hypothetical protein
MTMRTLVLVAALLLATTSAAALERTFAGSAQLDYQGVPTQPIRDGNAGNFRGFTLEASIKLAVDVTEHISANVKFCYGCHGFELDMAYLDLRAFDELNVRVGRFSPSFGSFNLRHDPANHKLSDKPLPYDMGRMLRKDAWNNGVLPSPFPDNGVEVNGTHWFGDAVQLDYATYAVMGFKSSDPQPFDFTFKDSHLPYYTDNNGLPTFGGRVAMTLRLSSEADTTLGASAMYGTYDIHDALTYAILGGDLAFRFVRTYLRLEYLVRRQEFDTSSPTNFRYALAPNQGDFFVKHGAFVELEQPITRQVDVIARGDGMYRVGNVPATSTLRRRSTVVRETLGLTYALDRSVRIKGSTELWEFTDEDARGHKFELGFHAAVVGTF